MPALPDLPIYVVRLTPQGFELLGDPLEPDEDADGKHGEIGSFVGCHPPSSLTFASSAFVAFCLFSGP